MNYEDSREEKFVGEEDKNNGYGPVITIN